MTLHSSLTGLQLHEPFNYAQNSDPGAVGAGKYWLDTTTTPYVLKRRNGGNDGWVTVGLASVDYGDLTGVPLVFPPDDHSHEWADITDPPATYAPTAHTHSESDITDLSHDAVALQGRDVAATAPTDGQALVWNDGDSQWAPGDVAAGDAQLVTFTFGVPGVLTVVGSPVRLLAPFACTIQNVVATVGTAPTGASVIVDVNKNGTTVFTTQGNRPTIAASTQDDTSAVPDVTALAQNDVVTLDVDQIGSTIAGSDLVVQVRCVRA